MEQAQIDLLVRQVIERLGESTDASEKAAEACSDSRKIPVEISARHAHLSKEHLRALFSMEELPRKRDISQPGQYLSECRVRVIGPKGVLDNVAVLGPVRGSTQVELSATDARALGVAAPVRLSGDLNGAARVYLQAGDRMVEAQAAIVAMRHLHLTLEEARQMGLRDGQAVCARVEGARPLTLEGVIVRASERSAARLHIDTDEANAAGVGPDTLCAVGGCAGAAAVAARGPEHDARADFEGKLIAEHEARELIRKGVRHLALRPGQIVTPLARDALRAGGVTLTAREEKT